MSNWFGFRKHVCEFSQTGKGCALCGEDGFVAGTSMLAESGWRDVSGIVVGDRLQTLEHGLQPIKEIKMTDIWRDPGTCPAGVCPLIVPVGGLGNTIELVIQGETMVAIASRIFEAESGSPYALMQGSDLEGFCGILRVQPKEPTKIYQLFFEHEELVQIGGGAVVCCRSETRYMNLYDQPDEESIQASAHGYPKLDHLQARALLARIELELTQGITGQPSQE